MKADCCGFENHVQSQGCPRALARGLGKVDHRLWHSISKAHFLCFLSSQRHIGNPTTGHHQEVRDTDSRAMGKGDRGPRKALFS